MLRYFKEFLILLRDVINKRYLLWVLIIQDFKSKYFGKYFGTLWAFVRPLVMILIMWFVFEVGFKAKPHKDIPFILWLMSGMIPWNYILDCMISTPSSILERSYLVKQVNFRVSLLPIVKVFSALFVHIFFIFFLIFVFWIYGFPPSIYYLQIPYYLGATIILMIGMGWFTSALTVYVRDIAELVNITASFLFWATPIFWDVNMFPGKIQFFLKLNPIFYLIQGYRDSFIYHRWFWEHPKLTLYFWIFTLFVVIVGAITFKKLRPYFADVI